MKPAARLQAAIDVIEQILVRHQPAATALSDWGKAHRFAGSGDRSAIGNLVYDTLRHRAMSAFHMRSDTPRALVLGALSGARSLDAAAVAALCDGTQHAPTSLTTDEHTRLTKGPPAGAADWQQANVPEWLAPQFRSVFGARFIAAGRAMACRAPIDLRANALKTTRDDLLSSLAAFSPVPTMLSPDGVRIAPPTGDGRSPNVEAEPAHGRGLFEVQDEGSQIAARLTGARPGQKILDLCAGAGGKTLALAAIMANQGSITAYDSDKSRLRPIFERLTRAGVTNVEVLPAGDMAALDTNAGSYDVVLVDAPCSGTGTWRRKPDAKWRLKPAVLAARRKDQQSVLERASRLTKPGGRLVYVTCSLLPEENTEQIATFLASHTHFSLLPWRAEWTALMPTPPPRHSADGRDDSLLLSPDLHDTDGFFIAMLSRRA